MSAHDNINNRKRNRYGMCNNETEMDQSLHILLPPASKKRKFQSVSVNESDEEIINTNNNSNSHNHNNHNINHHIMISDGNLSQYDEHDSKHDENCSTKSFGIISIDYRGELRLERESSYQYSLLDSVAEDISPRPSINILPEHKSKLFNKKIVDEIGWKTVHKEVN